MREYGIYSSRILSGNFYAKFAAAMSTKAQITRCQSQFPHACMTPSIESNISRIMETTRLVYRISMWISEEWSSFEWEWKKKEYYYDEDDETRSTDEKKDPFYKPTTTNAYNYIRERGRKSLKWAKKYNYQVFPTINKMYIQSGACVKEYVYSILIVRIYIHTRLCTIHNKLVYRSPEIIRRENLFEVCRH